MHVPFVKSLPLLRALDHEYVLIHLNPTTCTPLSENLNFVFPWEKSGMKVCVLSSGIKIRTLQDLERKT